jgi:hypothetical protein
MSVATPELMLRSVDDSWTYARWEGLPADGNRYEVIDQARRLCACGTAGILDRAACHARCAGLLAA